MEQLSAFFVQNIVYVYFFYGLAFFGMALVVLLESGRASEFRFARALRPLAYFGFLHGAHEWFEMFQIFAAKEGGLVTGVGEELLRCLWLALSFVLLIDFGTRLLPGAEDSPGRNYRQDAVMVALWALAVWFVYLWWHPSLPGLLAAADVLARYSLAIPGSLLAAWALLRERRDFHARGMSQYGGGLLWAAGAFAVYGVIGQIFVRPSLVFPSQTVNAALFLRTFGVPVQLLRGLAAGGIALSLASALRAFESEGRLRLARANKARIEAQAAALEAQQRRSAEVEALNVELQTTARELASLVDLSRILSSSLDLRQVIGDGLAQIVHSFDRACCAMAFLRRPDDGFELAGEYRRPNAQTPALPPPLTGVAAAAAGSGDPAGAGLDGVIGTLSPQAFAVKPTYRTLGVPLRAKSEVIGGLALSSVRADEPLGEDELELLTAFAQQIATTVENSRLYQVVQERELQLEDLVRRLVNAQEEERRRIARELHDETGQKLTALGMGLAAVATQLTAGQTAEASAVVRDLRDVGNDAIIELRHIMANLRPAQLDDLGLVPALRWYVAQHQGRHPEQTVRLVVERLPSRLPPQHETVLFRAAQEALTNVARHAAASEVILRLSLEGDSVRLEIEDNGVGFDITRTPMHEIGSGLGLVGMRERVALVGGRCQVDSAPGTGTHVRVDLPLRSQRVEAPPAEEVAA